MNIPLSLRIALRFRHKQQIGNMVSLVSVISTMGIMIGVIVLIIGLSAMNGFERELNNRILAIVPHGEIEPIKPPLNNWQIILQRIKQVPNIITAAPYLNFTGLIEGNEKRWQIIQIRGIDLIQEPLLSSLPLYIQGNNWNNFQSGKQQIIIGQGVANALKIKLGDWLTIKLPNDNQQMKFLQLKRIHLQVSGILALNSQLDHNLAVIPLIDAQSYLQREGDVSGIAIKVSNIFNANKLVSDAAKKINASVKVRSWINTYGYMYHDIQMIRAIMYLAMILVIGVACFNIVSTLVMAVENKSVDIAILCTLGANRGLIRAIFLWYGLLAGLTGSIIGVTVGLPIAIHLTTLAHEFEKVIGRQLLSGNIYFIDFLPTELHWIDITIIIIVTLILSLLASWYPSRRASSIDPVKILKHSHTY